MSAALDIRVTAALETARVVQSLNAKWKPHEAQAQILRRVFRDKRPMTFVVCGRKFGKTEIIAYFLWRLALTRPGGYYYFVPELKQGREIVWVTNRLQTFGPQSEIESINETEMRIWLKNGSFIKVDGSDNYQARRGIEPHGCAYDEFKDFKPEFHAAMDPNLAVYEAPLLICGTPPETMTLEHYDALEGQAKRHADHFTFPTWCNPHIKRSWLKAKKEELYARGDGHEWEREYGAMRVFGGKHAIFPMFKRVAPIVRPHKEIIEEVRRDAKKLIWQVIADPGTTSVFAALFRAINPFNRKVYRLGNLYVTEQIETSTSRMIPRIEEKKEYLLPNWKLRIGEWDDEIYDEAGAWFASEAMASFPDLDHCWVPTQKALKDKKVGLSLIKDQMLHGLYEASDECTDLFKEVEGYIRKPDGTIPKGNDHLIDCDRYGNDGASCDLHPEAEPEKKDPLLKRRAYSPEEDLAGVSDAEEWDEGDDDGEEEDW